jgi:hypothetical protein
MDNDLRNGRRAQGAMIFFGFGTLWILNWVIATYGASPGALAPLALLSASLIALAIARRRHYRRRRAAAGVSAGAAGADAEAVAARRTATRQFIAVNVAQSLAIVVAVNVLRHTGHGAWICPAIMLIVGLHFLPLARTFASRAHAVTGWAVVALAVLYPQLAPGGAADALGCLGAGLILWASAMWALKAAAPAPEIP